jgi:hypothetical protein
LCVLWGPRRIQSRCGARAASKPLWGVLCRSIGMPGMLCACPHACILCACPHARIAVSYAILVLLYWVLHFTVKGWRQRRRRGALLPDAHIKPLLIGSLVKVSKRCCP